MIRFWLTLFYVLLIPQISRADISTTRPMPGIILEKDVRTDPPQRLFFVTIDLTNPHIHLKVSRGSGTDPLTPPWEAQLMTVAQMAERDGLTVAVNGSLFQCKEARMILGRKVPYFPGNWARACGWTMSDGVLFSQSPADITWPSLIVTSSGKVSIGQLKQIPPDAWQIVSGVWQIVKDGRETGSEESFNKSEIAPRTAVGLDQDGKTLTLLVVDGRRPDYSAGMNWHDVAREMIARNQRDVLLLDGGGSSMLVMRNSQGKADVVNSPSDGHDLPVALSIPRSVADVFGVIVDGVTTQP